jgi:hypothetical protein
MQLRFQLGLATLAFATVALAQNPITADSPFQVRYASNLNIGDSVINITNTGAASGNNICVNVYTFSPDEQEVSCCACLVTPNALQSLSVKNDLISNTLTPAVPTSVVVKLLATIGGATVGSCNAATAGAGTATTSPGLAAWGTTLHGIVAALGAEERAVGLTETPFTPATLSATELTRITSLCGFIQSNGSGFGICRSCRLGGLGAVTQ